MTEGATLLCTDNNHSVVVQKIISNQSLIVECFDKQLSFVRIITFDDLDKIVFGSWTYLLFRR
jgi:hypothetical protein